MNIKSKHLFKILPDAVLLDTDNTLYPYDPAHDAAKIAVREKVKTAFSISSDEFEHTYLKARSEVKGRLKGVASSHSRLLYMQRMLELMGMAIHLTIQ